LWLAAAAGLATISARSATGTARNGLAPSGPDCRLTRLEAPTQDRLSLADVFDTTEPTAADSLVTLPDEFR